MTTGRIEVIAGPMFAGKTEELLRRMRRAAIAHRTVQLFTHRLDHRSAPGTTSSHSGLNFPSERVAAAIDLESAVGAQTEIVGIDEAQFFGPELLEVVDRMADAGKQMIIAGLVVTFDGSPFSPLPELMSRAERVYKLTAVCSVCGADAVFHQRIEPVASTAAELTPEHVGGLEKYEARCREHFSYREATYPLS
ncbi:MAG: thymidine kinase [Chloroflexota bacterium]